MVFENIELFEQMLTSNDCDTVGKLIRTPLRSKPSGSQNRSYLMLSANQVRHLNKLDTLQADTVMINLEDGVSPEQKKIARYLAAVFISNLKHSQASIVVRVNPLGEGGEEDIALLNRARPDAIRVPKIRTKEDAELSCRLIDPGIDVHFSIETKEAFSAIPSLKIQERVTTFYLGALDLLADLEIPQSVIAFDNETMAYLLGKFLIECKSCGVTPVFFTYQEYTKLESFRHWCKKAKTMGYTGTSCISPAQTAIANEVFGESTDEIAKAQYIVQRFETMAKQRVTGFTDERFGFIDEPIYKGALSILKNR